MRDRAKPGPCGMHRLPQPRKIERYREHDREWRGSFSVGAVPSACEMGHCEFCWADSDGRSPCPASAERQPLTHRMVLA